MLHDFIILCYTHRCNISAYTDEMKISPVTRFTQTFFFLCFAEIFNFILEDDKFTYPSCFSQFLLDSFFLEKNIRFFCNISYNKPQFCFQNLFVISSEMFSHLRVTFLSRLFFLLVNTSARGSPDTTSCRREIMKAVFLSDCKYVRTLEKKQSS